MSLTWDEMNRYSQQLKLDAMGTKGQLKLKNARVLCIGAGGLGSSVLLYLVAAGVGTIGIVDDDAVELSNLHRQILYRTIDIGHKKAFIAQQHLSELNPNVEFHVYSKKIDLKNAKELIAQYDIVADCSDNFATRYLINDICFQLNKPYAFASIFQFKGQCTLFLGKNTPCLRCLFPFESVKNTLPDCSEGGVLGVLPGLLGVIQATEIIKWILKFDDTLAGHLLTVDLRKMQFRRFKLTQNPECSLCVLQQPMECLPSYPTCSMEQYAVSVYELQQLKNDKSILLLDVRSAEEHLAFNLGGMTIPLSDLSIRFTELNSDRFIIAYCQSGKRSIQAAHFLKEAHFDQVRYLQGGINEWRRVTSAQSMSTLCND